MISNHVIAGGKGPSFAFSQNAYLSCLMDNSGAPLSPNGRFSNAIPFFVAVLATGLFLLMLVTGVMQTTGGFYSYPLDDPYIHMQIGKNLAFNSTWGIKPGVFESASSSLIYPVQIGAAFRIFGVHNTIPLWLNGIAGVMLLFVANKWLLKQSFSILARTILLLLAAFLMPLPVVISTGMEHCFQTLTTFLFLTRLSDYPAKTDEKERCRLLSEIAIYAILVTGFRYEGLFLVAAGAMVLLWYRQYRAAVAVVVAGIVPVLVFGLYSLSKGSYFLPNSVILKSYFPVSVHDFPGFARLLFNHFLLGPMDDFPSQICFLATERLLFALPLLYLLIGKNNPSTASFKIFVPALFFGVLFQLIFASTGWFFRYEAYLIFCGAIIIPSVLYKTIPPQVPGRDQAVKLSGLLLLIFLVTPAFVRAGEAFKKNKTACINIFEQQCQSARFINQFYNHSVVAAIDIGAVSFFTDAEIVDLVGLGNIDVARHWKQNTVSPEYLAALMKQKKVEFAISAGHFREDFFSHWVLVARMEISNNFACGSARVNFYVPDLKDKSALQSNLRTFQSAAPRTVAFSYY